MSGHSFTNTFLYGGIYLIKETESPFGYEISQDGAQGILAVPDDMETAELQKLQELFGSNPPQVREYAKNEVTSCIFKDKKLEGGGPLRLNRNYHLLVLELEKVLGESKTPLPGVTFEASLYSGEKKQAMMRMAEMITGVTGQQPDNPKPGYAVSAPIDLAHYFDALCAVYPGDLKESVTEVVKRTAGEDVSSYFGDEEKPGSCTV